MFIQRRSLVAGAAIPSMSMSMAPCPANPVRSITPFAPGGHEARLAPVIRASGARIE